MIERAVVLAAGRGTRLGALTDDTPKPLLEVAGASLISHVLEGIRSAGIHEVVVVTGYRSADIEDHVWGFAGLSIRFARQEAPRGTAHALEVASSYLRDRMFLFAWGDILVDPVVYRRVVLAAEQSDAVLAINEVADPTVGAAVTVDDEMWVTGIVEKPPPGESSTRWNNSGIGVLGSEAWQHIDRVEPSERGELELTAAIATMIDRGAKIRAVPVEGYWYDIGTPASLAEARAALS